MEDSFVMIGGDGPTSYSQNSKYQGLISSLAKAHLVTSIQRNLPIRASADCTTAPQVLRIADLGCSVGPNTLSCVRTIMEAIELEPAAARTVEFQAFLNDQVSSDFNTLFRALPRDRPYTVAGVPGSFRGKLFPRASMNIMHSSFAIYFLGKVPEEVKNPESPAWNTGKITYCESSEEVMEAYLAQFQAETENFFNERSVEMVDDGLLAILIPCRPEGTAVSESMLMQMVECLLGHLLVDMVKEGLVDEQLGDSFNLPVFIPTAAEVREAASKVDCLSIEVVEKIRFPKDLVRAVEKKYFPDDLGGLDLHAMLRAVLEDTFRKHFGQATADLLFSMLPVKVVQKLSESPPPPCLHLSNSDKFEHLFMVLKKKGGSVV